MSTNSSILAIPQIFLSSPVENVLVGQSKGTDHGVKNSECTADRKEALRHTATSSNQCSSERRRRNKVVSTSSHFTASHLQAQSVPCALEKATECSPPAAPTAAPVPHKVRPVVRRRSPALSTMELLTAGPKISKTHGIALLRVTLFFSCILLVLCLHTEQLLAKGQLVHDCKSTPSLRNGNVTFIHSLACVFASLAVRVCPNDRLCVRSSICLCFCPLSIPLVIDQITGLSEFVFCLCRFVFLSMSNHLNLLSLSVSLFGLPIVPWSPFSSLSLSRSPVRPTPLHSIALALKAMLNF